MLYISILILLWAINFAPPLLAYFLEDRWNTPLDLGLRLPDGKPLFGPHKTIRGIFGATAAGALAGILLGFGAGAGALTGLCSMGGDLTSSFIKRRFAQSSGQDVPGLDQGLEGLFPLLYLGAILPLTPLDVFLLLLLFAAGAFAGSKLYKYILFHPRSGNFKRPQRPRVMMKEFASCRLKSRFLRPFFNFEDAIYYHLIIQSMFRLFGLYEKGKLNALNFQTRSITLSPPELPEQFDGYRILFMTDLHLDGLHGLSERLQTVLGKVDADLCILGGDYRMSTHGSCSNANSRLKRIVAEISAPDGIFAVLGNHDCLEMADLLQECGATVLLNEAAPVFRNGATIWVAGVDDPHYYKCHDVQKAFQDIPEGAFSLFVAHSPKLYREAASAGARLYLAGHTHAGQVQLPKIGPVFTHCPAPRRFCLGQWDYNGMAGFTSAGVGVSGVPVRFNCHGEVAVVTLKRALA